MMTYPGIRLRAHLIAAAFLLLAALLAAQTGSGKPQLKQRSAETPVFKKAVRRVLVDVVVQDANGKPVRGLTAKDFQVVEDGKPQRILTFDVHDFEASAISIPTNAPTLPPNTFVNVPSIPERGPLYVILYDLVNTEIDDQMAARQQLLKFIDRKPKGARFAIFVLADRLFLLQGFTTDDKLLHAAVISQGPGPHLPRAFLYGDNYGRDDPVRMEAILHSLSLYLEGLPGRKNLIWVSGGFPLSLFPKLDEEPALVAAARETLGDLARGEIALYPVNVRGIVTAGEDTTLPPPRGAGGPAEGVGNNGPVIGGVSGGAAAAQNSASARTTAIRVLRESISSNDTVADESGFLTGGRSFLNRNDLRNALAEAVDHGSSYYTLTYSPSKQEDDGSRRRIEVRLARPRCRLFYRQFYYATASVVRSSEGQPVLLPSAVDFSEDKDGVALNSKLSTTLLDNMWHGAPLAHQLILKVRISALGTPYPATLEQMAKLAEQPVYARQRKGKKDKALEPVQLQKYEIYYVVAASQVRSQQNHPIPLEFAAVAFDEDGWARNAIFQRASDDNDAIALKLEPTTDSDLPRGRRVIRARQELDVPLEAKSLRVAVWDTSNDHIGALEIPLPLAPEPSAIECKAATDGICK